MATPANFVTVNQNWRTEISNVEVTGRGSCAFLLTRPDSGDAQGGYISVYKNEINTQNLVHRQYAPGLGSGPYTVDSDKIDFNTQTYWLCYGPFYSDQQFEVVTSVQLNRGRVTVAQASLCYGISYDVLQWVKSYYIFDSNPLGFGAYNGTIILREGSKFGVGPEIGRANLDKNGPSEGTATIRLNQPLKRGTTYNVITSIYSDVRPVAGYTFTTAK